MKFIYAIYILTVIFVENKEKLLARCINDLDENELVHLSQKLNPLECVKLVQAAYELTLSRVKHKAKKHGVLRENLIPMSTSPEECLFNLEQWSNDFPKSMKLGGRAAMEMTLRWLGRPDLAKYVRDSHRSIKFPDKEDDDTVEALEFPEHAVFKRHTSKKDEQRSTNESKKSKGKKNKRHHKEVQKAVGAAKVHAVAKKTRQLKKKGDNCPNSVAHQSICWSIFFILLFIAVCLLIAYIFYKRKHSKARGTRFKYDRNGIKEDKDTFTDYLEWEDEAICSCSDIEGGCTGKCPMCSRNDQTQPVASHRTANDDSVEDFNNIRKMKKKKEKKRQRFNFLQKTFQTKKNEKDQENRDRKKTLETSAVKKHEKAPIILSKDQCVCCRCALISRDKMIREKKENEKRELNRWKAKKRKEEKRRKKEESRKVDRHANVCYNETCK